MDVWTVLLIAGIGALMGGIISAKIVAKRAANAAPPEPIRILASSSDIQQQQDALNRMRDSNLALTTKMHELTQQYDSMIEAMRKSHALERAGFEEEQRRLKEQLTRIAAAAKGGSLISADSFAPTQFDEAEGSATHPKPAGSPAAKPSSAKR
jgi:esterase/lipase